MVGVGMNGLPSTKLGGIASKRRVYGPRQNTFRFYRIQFTDNERNLIETYYTGADHNINYLHMQDREDGENLLFQSRVTISSNYFNQATMDAWLNNIQLEDSAIIARLNMEIGHNPYIEIDFKYPQFIHSYAMLIEHMHSGWRILGSHDGLEWIFLQDTTPEAALDGMYPTVPTVRPSRYQVHVLHGKAMQPKPDSTYLRWGIITYTEGDPNDYSRLYTIEFRDGVGGANLCTGGTPDMWASNYLLSHPDIFDGNDTTYEIVRNNVGVGYLFASAVKPVTVAIRSGDSYDLNPSGFHVLSSNNGKIWYYHKYFATPDGTWPTGSVTTQEFVL